MLEDKLIVAAHEVEDQIRDEMRNRHMQQNELAELIGEGSSQLNRAIKGDISPKSVVIRSKIYRVLDIE